MVRRSSVGAAFLLLLSSCSHYAIAEEQTDVPTVDELLARVADVYSRCRSYKDTGTQSRLLRGVLGGLEREVVEEIRFTTTFVRPARFRFEFTEADWPNYRYLIWRDAAVVRTYWDLASSIRTSTTLDSALATAAGVSRRASHMVPALLLPNEIRGTRITEMSDASLSSWANAA